MEKTSNNKVLIPIMAILILAFIYIFPRIILNNFDAGNPWACYLYQYGFGFVTFMIGLLLIFKTGAVKLGRGRDTFWFGWLIAGFLIFAVGHIVWILLALHMPVKG
ncbi:MAG: hypothetical protein KAQ98_08535 [Bacteriovoracaceae bacterium]|nr:hypothetical protein [Bacteriovoracaceae bacterium]